MYTRSETGYLARPLRGVAFFTPSQQRGGSFMITDATRPQRQRLVRGVSSAASGTVTLTPSESLSRTPAGSPNAPATPTPSQLTPGRAAGASAGAADSQNSAACRADDGRSTPGGRREAAPPPRSPRELRRGRSTTARS